MKTILIIGVAMCANWFDITVVHAAERPVGNEQVYEQPQIISFIELIAEPAKFSGKMITIHGVLSIEFEDVALYASHEAYQYVRLTDRIRLILSNEMIDRGEPMRGEVVVVTGRFYWIEAKDGYKARREMRDIDRIDRIMPREKL